MSQATGRFRQLSPRDRHLRRSAFLFLLAAALGVIAPTLRSSVEAAPTAARVVFTGWNVGATARVCEVDSTIAGSVCSTLPLTDASPDATSGVEVADLNGDALLDVVLANENGSVNVCLDDGVGGWTCANYGPTARHNGVIIEDFDGDVDLDLVVVVETAAQMEVCLNSGTGTFSCTTQATPNWTTRGAAVDVDLDLDLDLVIAGDGSGVFECINDGSATFTCGTFAGATNGWDVEPGDVDFDGYTDLVFTANGNDDTICFGEAVGGFTCSVLDIGGVSIGATVEDFDGDSFPDVVIAHYNEPSRMCSNLGARSFSCSDLSAPSGPWRDLEVADVTGDGAPDLVVGVQGQNLICHGDGAGDVTSCDPIDSAAWHTLGVAILDIAVPPPDADFDGVPDSSDNCPSVANPAQTDTDADTLGDACDDDDDADGLLDVDETGVYGTNPLDPDTDGDGASDFDEVSNGWDPLLPPQPQTVSLTAPTTWAGVDGDLALVVSATSGLPVSVAATGTCSATGPIVTPTGPGTCDLTLDQAGDGDWLAAPTVNASISMVTLPQSVVWTAPATLTVGDVVTATAVADSGLTTAVSASGTCTLSGSTLTAIGVGTCTLTADQAGDIWWDVAPTATQVVTVSAVPTTTTTTTTMPVTTTTTATTTTTTTPTTATTTVTTTTVPVATAATTTTSSTTTSSTSTSSTTSVPATTTTLPGPDVVIVRTDLADLLANGLPAQTWGGTRLVIEGLLPGSEVELRQGLFRVVGIEADGTVVLDLDPAIDLEEATIVIRRPDGTVARITSSDVFVDGDVELALAFDVAAGAPVGGTTVRVRGAGFLGGTPISVSLHSTPRLLTTLAAGTDGTFDELVTLPGDVEPGEHRVLASGLTPEGPINGEWHFALDETGTVERVGDPPPAVAPDAVQPTTDPTTEPTTEPASGPVAEATSAVEPAVEPDAEPAVEPAAASVVIDERTGLPEYSPVDEPEEAVADTVEAFALLSLVGASGSLLAAGMTGGPLGSTGGAPTPGGSGGGSAKADDRRRGKGKVAGGKAAKFGDTIEGNARGDLSRTWRWPLTFRLDDLGRAWPDRLHPYSPLAGRVVADGSTNRAVLGTGSLLLPLAAIVLAVAAAIDTGGLPVAPGLGFMLSLVVIGIFDASAGFLAALTFGLAVTFAGGVDGADSVRALLGIGSLWFAISLIAGAVRAFRRGPSDDWAGRWTGVAEIVVGSLLAAWTASGVTSSLPALSGLDMPIATRADFVALVALLALAARYGYERMAVRWYPERLVAVTFEPDGKPAWQQQVVSVLVKAGVMVFVITPYIGMRWQLGVVVALTVGPSIVKIWKKRLPNSAQLYRVLPQGVPNTLLMMTVGTVVGSTLAARIEDPERLLATSFLVLALPGFVLSVLGLIGRDGADPAATWAKRLAGAWVAAVAVLKIRGHLGGSPWLPVVLVAPLVIWWAVATTRAARAAADEDEIAAADEREAEARAAIGTPIEDDEPLTLAELDELPATHEPAEAIAEDPARLPRPVRPSAES